MRFALYRILRSETLDPTEKGDFLGSNERRDPASGSTVVGPFCIAGPYGIVDYYTGMNDNRVLWIL